MRLLLRRYKLPSSAFTQVPVAVLSMAPDFHDDAAITELVREAHPLLSWRRGQLNNLREGAVLEIPRVCWANVAAYRADPSPFLRVLQ